MSWNHYNPVRITVGAGLFDTLAPELPDGSLLLLTTAGLQRRGTVARLTSAANAWTVRMVAPNPDLDELDSLAARLRGRKFAAIVALGGGSVIDAAKALSVLLPAERKRALHAHLRQQAALDFGAALPLLCIPTTAGTGAEVTPFATIWDGAGKQKHSLCDDALFPKRSLLDPELTISLPWTQTLYGALDATSHALETLWNRNATPISGALALQALQMIATNLPRVHAAPQDLDARAQLQQASLLAGLAISQNRTALAHAVSYPLTARFGVAHGLACSFTLPALLRWVRTENAWTVPLPAALGDTLLALLDAQQLGQQLLQQCRREQVLGCLGEMFDPQRAGNFVIAASHAEVLRILEASLGQPPLDQASPVRMPLEN